jgi:glycerol-3-phosphate dehydrogenase
VPETSDGRLLFVLNYFGHPLVGTTDVFDDATFHCEPSEKEIDFLIEEIKPFLGKDFDYKGNLLSAWAGQRPLVKSSTKDKAEEKDPRARTMTERLGDYFKGGVRWLAFKVNGPKKSSSASIARNHVIEVSDSGLVSLMGGKWTAYRVQGEQTVDRILKDHPEKF